MKKIMFLLILLLVSCTTETEVTNDTIIINNSGHIVKFTAYGRGENIVIDLDDGDAHTESRTGQGGADIFPHHWADSVYILFDNELISKFYNKLPINDNRSPFSYDAYENMTTDEHKNFYRNVYTYTICEEDFQRAVPIKDQQNIRQY